MPSHKIICSIAILLLSCVVAACNVQSNESVSTVAHVTPNEAQAQLEKDSDIVVLDIRTPEEFAAGHIPGAINIDYHAPDYAAKIKTLDTSKTYLMHCAGGGRSGRSLALFAEVGLDKLLHLEAGYRGWDEANLPTEK